MSNAFVYADATFASTNQPWVNGNNTFTAIAKDSYGRIDTNTETVNLQMTNNFAYDLNGNMITNGNQTLDYDDENELIRVTVTNNFKKEYVYDGMHRLRIRKEFGWISSAWTQTNEIHYIYDGKRIIQLRDTNNLPTLTFTRGLDLSGSLQGAGGTGGLLAMTENPSSTHSYYHADGNGNITMLINLYQLPVGKYGYDSFGNPLWESGTKAFVNPFWFSSQIYDSDTGFLQYLYRIYIPELDRWLNRDPIQEQGGINLYGYANNNPISYSDIMGLCPIFVQISVDTPPANISASFNPADVQSVLQSQLSASVFNNLAPGDSVNVTVSVGAKQPNELGWLNGNKYVYKHWVFWGETPTILGITIFAITPAPGETKINPNLIVKTFKDNGWGSPGTQFWVNMLAHEVIWLGASDQQDQAASDDINSQSANHSSPFTVSSASRSVILSNFGLQAK